MGRAWARVKTFVNGLVYECNVEFVQGKERAQALYTVGSRWGYSDGGVSFVLLVSRPCGHIIGALRHSDCMVWSRFVCVLLLQSSCYAHALSISCYILLVFLLYTCMEKPNKCVMCTQDKYTWFSSGTLLTVYNWILQFTNCIIGSLPLAKNAKHSSVVLPLPGQYAVITSEFCPGNIGRTRSSAIVMWPNFDKLWS